MPARKRGGSFGGNLLQVPTPLPDDEPETVEPSASQHVGDVVVLAPEPNSPAVEEPEPEDLPERVVDDVPQAPSKIADRPASKRRGSAAAGDRAARDKPPATIRLDDRAAPSLWDAFVDAKRVDPFLSYRQFASGVVLDGLAVHRRRQSRSS